MTTYHRPTHFDLLDYEPQAADLREAAVLGLSGSPRTIPSQFFYDAAGSRLFEQICGLPGYYLTRTELRIMQDHLPAMAERIGEHAVLIELGSGEGVKTRHLLAALDDPAAYVPIDIARQALRDSARRLQDDFPDLPVLPVCADYSRPFELPVFDLHGCRRTVYFPGSTLGNLHRPEARRLFARMRDLAGDDGGLLLGVDRVKSPAVMVPAYDDPQGVTAAFNLNLLRRLNREADADFHPDRWRHEARWNAARRRMESHLVSIGRQRVCVADHRFGFADGESIWSESSYKYDLADVRELADGRFELVEAWSDARDWFSVMYLRAV